MVGKGLRCGGSGGWGAEWGHLVAVLSSREPSKCAAHEIVPGPLAAAWREHGPPG